MTLLSHRHVCDLALPSAPSLQSSATVRTRLVVSLSQGICIHWLLFKKCALSMLRYIKSTSQEVMLKWHHGWKKNNHSQKGHTWQFHTLWQKQGRQTIRGSARIVWTWHMRENTVFSCTSVWTSPSILLLSSFVSGQAMPKVSCVYLFRVSDPMLSTASFQAYQCV